MWPQGREGGERGVAGGKAAGVGRGPGGGNAAIRSQRPCGSGCIFLQHIPPCCCVFHDKNVITAVPTSIPRGSWLHVQKQLIGLALFAGQVHSKVEKQKWGF